MARPPALAVAAVLLALAFTGCLTAEDAAGTRKASKLQAPPSPGIQIANEELSQPIYKALAKTRHYVTAAIEGIRLYTEVYLPDGPGPWPTVIVNSPYYDHGLNGASSPDANFRNFMVPRGYAVVLADVRGTGYSEGCMNMMGPKEQRDTYDLVEWVANQTWSDGNVGMYGVSYVGTTPHEALIMAPPHLKTVVTIAGVTNQWRNTFQNGVPYANRFYPITYEATEGLPPPGDYDRGAEWARNTAMGACEQDEALKAMSPGTYEKGVYDKYWKDRNFTLQAHKATASIFYNQGFTDRAVNPMEAVHWYNELPVPKKSYWGQWPHRTPQRQDWNDTYLAWFDHWLKGRENGIMDSPPVEVILNNNRIRTDTKWPPANTTPLILHLAPGALQEDAPASGRATYLADNAARGSEGPLLESSPRPLRLAFQTPPLAADVHMAGVPWAHLRASVNADNTYFLLSLFDVEGSTWREVGEGWMNAHLWQSFDKSSPLTPGKEYDFHFKFEPREYVFPAGHKIGLQIRGSDSRVSPFDKAVTENTIVFGAEGSRIELPTLLSPQTYERPDGI
ncbi:MAG TPA: CocE/NonD family hydrolase [Candidatus Thermoplasmatota archaeon]|nr:CocE/NonD family hydrolase [Candidatus Thermoplasmatota archaeon]